MKMTIRTKRKYAMCREYLTGDTEYEVTSIIPDKYMDGGIAINLNLGTGKVSRFSPAFFRLKTLKIS